MIASHTASSFVHGSNGVSKAAVEMAIMLASGILSRYKRFDALVTGILHVRTKAIFFLLRMYSEQLGNSAKRFPILTQSTRPR